MSFFEEIQKRLAGEDAPKEDYFKRNSGKKVMATILEPSEKELAEQKERHDSTNLG